LLTLFEVIEYIWQYNLGKAQENFIKLIWFTTRLPDLFTGSLKAVIFEGLLGSSTPPTIAVGKVMPS
jgi:hypothetical protein